jgi:hypothetical protein
VGQAEDEIRIDAEDALGAIDGLEVRRVARSDAPNVADKQI